MVKNATEQMPLIDVDDPRLKVVKKQITEYESLLAENREQGASNRAAEQAKRKKVLEAVEKAGIPQDGEGVYHVPCDGYIYDISQEAQLKITSRKAPKEEKATDEPPK